MSEYLHIPPKRVGAQNPVDREKKLILKLYRKQLSLFNKGKGPKPDLQTLISKSRHKHLKIEESEVPTPEDKEWMGVHSARELNIPRSLPEFTKQRKSESGFYILTFEGGIKIGISKNINRRVKEYEHPWCKPVLQSTFLYVPYKIAADIELGVKRKLFSSYSSGSHEYFKGKTDLEIIQILRSLSK